MSNLPLSWLLHWRHHCLFKGLMSVGSKGSCRPERRERMKKVLPRKLGKKHLKTGHFEKERTPSSKHQIFKVPAAGFESVYFSFFFPVLPWAKITSHGGQWNFSSLKMCKIQWERTYNSLKLTNIAPENRPKLCQKEAVWDHLTQTSKFAGCFHLTLRFREAKWLHRCWLRWVSETRHRKNLWWCPWGNLATTRPLKDGRTSSKPYKIPSAAHVHRLWLGWVTQPFPNMKGCFSISPYVQLRRFSQMVRCRPVMNPMGSQSVKKLPTKTNPSCRQQGLQGRMIIDHRKDESQLLGLEM